MFQCTIRCDKTLERHSLIQMLYLLPDGEIYTFPFESQSDKQTDNIQASREFKVLFYDLLIHP